MGSKNTEVTHMKAKGRKPSKLMTEVKPQSAKRDKKTKGQIVEVEGV